MIFYFWDYQKFGLYKISFYPGLGLDMFHCIRELLMYK